MPAINIPQAEAPLYNTLLNFRQRRATADVTEAQADLANANARLDTQSADYYDKTGASKASQDEEKIQLGRDELTQRLQQYQLELRKSNNEIAQKNFATMMDAAATVSQARANNPKMSHDDAEGLWRGLMHAGGVADDVQTHGLYDLPDDNSIEAMAQVSGKGPKFTNVGERTIGKDAQGNDINAEVQSDNMGNMSTTARNKTGQIQRQPLAGLGMSPSITRTQQVSEQEDKELRDKYSFTANEFDTMKAMANVLAKDPNANTKVADLAGFANNIGANVQALAQQGGTKLGVGDFDPNKWVPQLESLGVHNSQLQSLIMNMAFQASLASGQGKNSTSDKDIPRFINIIGAHAENGKTFASNLLQFADLQAKAFNNARSARPSNAVKWGDQDPSTDLQNRFNDLSGVVDQILNPGKQKSTSYTDKDKEARYQKWLQDHHAG